VKPKTVIGILISVVFLYLALRRIHLSELATALKQCDYLYVIPGVLLVLFIQVLRSIRWHYLLKPIKKVSFKNLFSATMIGLMANNIFPARAGEFVRAKIIGDDENISKSSAFATLVIERVFDGLTILLILLLTFLTVDLSKKLSADVAGNLKQVAYGVLGFYFLVIIFILLVVYCYDTAERIVSFFLRPFPDSVSNYANKILDSFREGLKIEKGFKNILLIISYSLLLWTLSVFPVYILLIGFGHPLPIEASFVTLIMLFFATIIPAAPGYVGTYHAGVMYALTLYGLSESVGFSVAVVLHMMNFFPIVIAGFIALWIKNISIETIEEVEESTL
jgi:uncharacterized protein (TIRG00374 family)